MCSAVIVLLECLNIDAITHLLGSRIAVQTHQCYCQSLMNSSKMWIYGWSHVVFNLDESLWYYYPRNSPFDWSCIYPIDHVSGPWTLFEHLQIYVDSVNIFKIVHQVSVWWIHGHDNYSHHLALSYLETHMPDGLVLVLIQLNACIYLMIDLMLLLWSWLGVIIYL